MDLEVGGEDGVGGGQAQEADLVGVEEDTEIMAAGTIGIHLVETTVVTICHAFKRLTAINAFLDGRNWPVYINHFQHEIKVSGYLLKEFY